MHVVLGPCPCLLEVLQQGLCRWHSIQGCLRSLPALTLSRQSPQGHPTSPALPSSFLPLQHHRGVQNEAEAARELEAMAQAELRGSQGGGRSTGGPEIFDRCLPVLAWYNPLVSSL